MDDDRQIEAELQRNFHLYKLVLHHNSWTDLHQNFTRYSGISDAIKSCIYKELGLFHSISKWHSDN